MSENPPVRHFHSLRVTEECLDLIAQAAFVSDAAKRAWQVLCDSNPRLRGLAAQQRIIKARAASKLSTHGAETDAREA
jgi:hypothetical protein